MFDALDLIAKYIFVWPLERRKCGQGGGSDVTGVGYQRVRWGDRCIKFLSKTLYNTQNLSSATSCDFVPS